MAKFRFTRIDPPLWSTQPDLYVHRVTVADYAKIQKHREKMLRLVHKEITEYMNDPRLYFDGDGEKGFPYRPRMTGDYYIGSESYTAYDNPECFLILVRCRCLGFPPVPKAATGEILRIGDYLGLTVWLRCYPKKWAQFEICNNTDSESI